MQLLIIFYNIILNLKRFHFVTFSLALDFFNIELNSTKGHQIVPMFYMAAYNNGSHVNGKEKNQKSNVS